MSLVYGTLPLDFITLLISFPSLQADVLFPSLSVEQHLRYFAKLRGIQDPELTNTLCQVLRDFQLEQRKHFLPSKLSGGSRRKLSLAISLLGNPLFIVLDEPTAGVDADSKKAIYGIIKNVKIGKVVVFTTHFMEEAELLSDRIGILLNGKLVCIGSSLFLKKVYSVGYILQIDSLASQNLVENEVSCEIPGAELLMKKIGEFKFSLPGISVRKLHNLLDRLQYISCTTKLVSIRCENFKDVFTKILHEWSRNQFYPSLHINPLISKFHNNWINLLAIRFVICCREWKSVIFQMAIPLVMMLIVFSLLLINLYPYQRVLPLNLNSLTRIRPHLVINYGLTNYTEELVLPHQDFDFDKFIYSNSSVLSSILLNPNLYRGHRYLGYVPNDSILVNTSIDWEWLETHPEFLNALGIHSVLFGISAEMLNFRKLIDRNATLSTFPVDTPRTNIYSSTLTNSLTILHNTSCFHCTSMSYGELIEAQIMRCQFQKYGNRMHYRSDYHPLPPTVQMNLHSSLVLAFGCCLLILIPFSIIPAYRAIVIIQERDRKISHQLRLAGFSSLEYWGSIYAFDYLLYLMHVFALFAIITCIGHTPREIFLGNLDITLSFALLLLCYGLSILPLTYVYSRIFPYNSSTIPLILTLHIMTSFGFLFFFFALNAFRPSTEQASPLSTFFRVFPGYTLGEGLFVLCNAFAQRKILKKQIQTLSFNNCGILILRLSLEALIYFLLVLILEYFSRYYSLDACLTCFLPMQQQQNETPTTLEEINYTLQLANAPSLMKEENVAICISCLSKAFFSWTKTVTVLNRVSFYCRNGDRFGLLGKNGSGKTTLVKILARELFQTAGKVFHGSDLDEKSIGYCPQIDPLFDLLSVTECLFFYGQIRGIDKLNLISRVEYLLRRISLFPFADQLCSRLSGGNKRKLSLALALIDNPKLLLLDEVCCFPLM